MMLNKTNKCPICNSTLISRYENHEWFCQTEDNIMITFLNNVNKKCHYYYRISEKFEYYIYNNQLFHFYKNIVYLFNEKNYPRDRFAISINYNQDHMWHINKLLKYNLFK